MKRVAFSLLILLGACSSQMTPEQAADFCEERARGAQGPSGEISIGANSETGTFVGGRIEVTSDFLSGRDPMAVYETCVIQRTGELPIRPPALR